MARYTARIEKFEKDGRPMPRLRHHALWLLHNCVAHPLLAVTGKNVQPLAVEFHELTSQWLNHKRAANVPGGPVERRDRSLQIMMPQVENEGSWFIHNVLAHVAIGLVPCKTTFDLHDWSAEVMGVPGWV